MFNVTPNTRPQVHHCVSQCVSHVCYTQHTRMYVTPNTGSPLCLLVCITCMLHPTHARRFISHCVSQCVSHVCYTQHTPAGSPLCLLVCICMLHPTCRFTIVLHPTHARRFTIVSLSVYHMYVTPNTRPQVHHCVSQCVSHVCYTQHTHLFSKVHRGHLCLLVCITCMLHPTHARRFIIVSLRSNKYVTPNTIGSSVSLKHMYVTPNTRPKVHVSLSVYHMYVTPNTRPQVHHCVS